MIRTLAAFALIGAAAAALAQAPANAPTRIRGTLENVDGNMLTI